jgi:LysW-gamma-L-lysine carboxypeptidase
MTASFTTHEPTPRPACEVSDDQALALLTAAVDTPSVSGHERPVAELLRRRAKELGLAATLDETGSFVAATSGDPLRTDPRTADIVLLGHIDTVPGHIPVRREGDRLYGRGSVDAKGPLAAFLVAAATTPLPEGVRIVVVGAVEEEIATSRGARAAATRYRPAACIIGEPSGWDAITIAYKGRLLTTCRLARPLSHTAGPASSVADEAHAWWTRVLAGIAALNLGREGAFSTVQATLRSIQTGSDGLREHAEVRAGFRLPPDVPPEEVRGLVASCAGSATLDFSGAEVAHVADRSNAVVRALSGSLRAAGITPRHLKKTGTSDMNVVGPIWGCPIAAYGAGDSSLDHTPEEHTLIPEFLRSIGILRGALERLAREIATGTPGVR